MECGLPFRGTHAAVQRREADRIRVESSCNRSGDVRSHRFPFERLVVSIVTSLDVGREKSDFRTPMLPIGDGRVDCASCTQNSETDRKAVDSDRLGQAERLGLTDRSPPSPRYAERASVAALRAVVWLESTVSITTGRGRPASLFGGWCDR